MVIFWIPACAGMTILDFNSKNMTNIEKIRHSLAHLLAAAVLEKYPGTKLGIGPIIENGFYYDFLLSSPISPQDLPVLENKIKKLIKQNLKFEKQEISAKEAKELFNNQSFKLELINDLEKENKPISIYTSGNFTDLCAGPHIDSTKEIDPEAFKLTKIAGAYWRGDEKNQMLTRIYGVAFESKKELDDYLKLQVELEKRDHRKLGKDLGLLVFSDLVGPGLPLYTPKGAFVRKQIQNYSNELRKEIGYQEVHTPNINKGELFKVSGHYAKYKDDMFKVKSNYSEEEYFLKPMNCPQHTQIYASQLRSYKDLPLRIADFCNLHRDERPGELSGLTRLRCFSQDDGHCFCREDQIKNEFTSVLKAINKAMKTYKLKYRIRLSLRDENKKEQYLGSDEIWKKSQKILEDLLKEKKVDYFRSEGDAAFYGPKMDLIVKDSLGREWQLSTIQLDFNMPSNFGLEYVGNDGQKYTPIMIHSALVGSPERFMGLLIEHYVGVFPLWLAPVQMRILPISKKHKKYAKEINKALADAGFRTELKDEDETIGKKIREGEMQKVPYLLIVGDKEIKAKSVAVRRAGKGDIGIVKFKKFLEQIQVEVTKKK